MINSEKALKAFKDKLENMSYEEREQYLSEMGFSFEPESEEQTAVKYKYASSDAARKNATRKAIKRAPGISAHLAGNRISVQGSRKTRKA